MSKSNEAVRIFEVGPRDGLQNEKVILSLTDKVWLIESLAAAGLQDIETGSFVRADRVPQMAESDQIPALYAKQQASRDASPALWYLVPNQRGLERAAKAGVSNIAVFTAVSNSFNQKNIGMTVEESLTQIEATVKAAKAQGMKVRGYVSTVWGCPFEGKIKTNDALEVIERLLSYEIEQVSVGDTIGIASPLGVEAVVVPLLKRFKPEQIAVHFHDTRGTALANALRSYELGVRTFDSSLGGLGGCPFAPGASGNLATEDLAYLFKEMEIPTGIAYAKLCETSLELSRRMGGRALQSRALMAFVSQCAEKNEWDI